MKPRTTMPQCSPVTSPPRCIIRADASPTIGAGHVMRCLSLAHALANKGWYCSFAVSPDTPTVVPALLDSPFPVDILTNGSTVSPPGNRGGCDLLIVDHYGLDAEYEAQARAWARAVLVVDELADRPHACDALLDQTLNRRPDDHTELVAPGTRLLLGADYALIREQFAVARNTVLAARASRKGRLQRVLITMGSTDPENTSEAILAALVTGHYDLDVTVILGPGAPHARTVGTLTKRLGPRICLRQGVSDMAEVMCEADLAIATAGSASYERCCLGLPTLIVTTGADQEPNARALDREGAAWYLACFHELNPDDLRSAVSALRADPERLSAMQHAAASVCDGRGPDRSASAITDIVREMGAQCQINLR